MRRNITVTCATCHRIVSYRNRHEARRNGWVGMGWERRAVHWNYWGECRPCAEKRKAAVT